MLYPGQGHVESGVYPGNTGYEVGIDLDWDNSPREHHVHTHSHTCSQIMLAYGMLLLGYRHGGNTSSIVHMPTCVNVQLKD